MFTDSFQYITQHVNIRAAAVIIRKLFVLFVIRMYKKHITIVQLLWIGKFKISINYENIYVRNEYRKYRLWKSY